MTKVYDEAEKQVDEAEAQAEAKAQAEDVASQEEDETKAALWREGRGEG